MGLSIWIAAASYTLVDGNKLHNAKIRVDNGSIGTNISNQNLWEIDDSGTGDFTRSGTDHENVREFSGIQRHKTKRDWTRISQIDTQFDSVENYRFQSRWANAGGIRALRFDAMYSASGSYSEVDGEYMSVYVSPGGSNPNNNGIAHATIGMPKNTGEFQIGTGASGYVDIVNNYMQDGDAVSVNVKGTANGVSNLWVEKLAWNKIRVHFSGTPTATITCSYLFIHSS